MILQRRVVTARASRVAALFFAATVATANAQPSAPAHSDSELRIVVVVMRHGVRSPTDPAELKPYSARPWPAWDVAPGELTPHGAKAVRNLGAAYRGTYAAAGIEPRTGCPPADSMYVWADVDQRTKATGNALLDGLAPNCGLTAHDAGAAVDPLFHALPSLGKADAAAASASLTGSIGAAPQAIVPAYALPFKRLDDVLGCKSGGCTPVSGVDSTIVTSPKTGLAEVQGPVGLASTAVEDFILAYADGRPLSDVGWGEVDRETLLALSQLHTLKFLINTQNAYAARVQGSNLLAHVLATIDQGASGRRVERTRAPVDARFVAFVGHDTNLAELAGMLRLSWLAPGYQLDDTPPGGGLVFEVRRKTQDAEPFVRVFFVAQSLDQMRSLSTDAPLRVPVFVPGCPQLDCPLTVFDSVVTAAIDPGFVGSW